MTPIDFIAQTMTRMGENLAYNLEYIPKDKLDWKPAPTANSALAIANHIAGGIEIMLLVFAGGQYSYTSDYPEATNLKEAQASVSSQVKKYVKALKKLKSSDLEKKITFPWGQELTWAEAVSLPMIDIIHHHGQIMYIQTLFGDTEVRYKGVTDK